VLLRDAVKLRLAARCLPAEGIELPCLESPPLTLFFPAGPSSAAVNRAADRPPPARTTPQTNPGENPVPVDPFPSLFLRRSAAPVRSPAIGRRRPWSSGRRGQARPRPGLVHPAWPGKWARAPLSVAMGQKDPSTKRPCAIVLFPETFQK
jgi:hypothetical protein